MLALKEHEFDDFYATRYGPLVRLLYLQTGDLSRAEESAQEAFLRAWQHRRKMSTRDPVRWVTQVAFRLAVSDWRRSRRLGLALARTDPPGSIVEGAPEDLMYVSHLMQQLSVEQRSVLVLHYFNDFSVDDVAKFLDVAPGTVKSRLSRAREQMRAIQKEEEAHGRSR